MSKKPPFKIILGFDPGLKVTGYGCIKTNGQKHQLLDSGEINTQSTDDLSFRLHLIYKKVRQLIKELQPDIVGMEKLFFFRNITSCIYVAQSQGVLILAAQQAKLPFFEHSPLQIKMTLTEYGRADKKQVQSKVQEMLNLSEKIKSNHCADALGVALTQAIKTI